MLSRPVSLAAPVSWQPGCVGIYPGQKCIMDLCGSGVTMTFCWCPPTAPGQTFLMSSRGDQPGDDDDERPMPITQGFWLAQHPVSQLQWQAVMGGDPTDFLKSPGYPMYCVSWNMTQEFCQKAGLSLPAETEWEYACRAGTTTPFGIGTGSALNSQLANFDGGNPDGSGRETFKWLFRGRTLQAGCFPPNAWGLHDMHGQLWEWCKDVFEGRDRVLRGGSWFDPGRSARSAARVGNAPDANYLNIGFRPCHYSIPAKAGGRNRTRAKE